MATDASAAESGFLTVDQAVTQLNEPEKEQDAAPAVVETPPAEEIEAAPTAEGADEPAAVIEGEETEQVEQEEKTLPAIEPPKFWDAEAKKRFSELPRDVQEIVSKNEQLGVTATAKSLEGAATARKAAEAEASKLAAYTGELDKLIPQAKSTFQSRWGNGEIDWAKVAEQHGVEHAFTLKNQYEQESKTLQQLETAKDVVEQQQFAKFVEAEAAKLPELVPDLVDPKEGPKRREALTKFLIDTGIPKDRIPYVTATEASVAYDAMRWREAQAQAKAKIASPVTPKPAAVTARPTVKPTAVPSNRNPQSARIQTLNRKPSLTIDEAVELANLKEQGT